MSSSSHADHHQKKTSSPSCAAWPFLVQVFCNILGGFTSALPGSIGFFFLSLAPGSMGRSKGGEQAKQRASHIFFENATETSVKEIVKLLRSKPQQVPACLLALQEDFFENRGPSHANEQWPTSYVRFDQVPKYWLVSWLSSALPWAPVSMLQEIDRVNKNTIRQIVEFGTGLRTHIRLPRACLNKQVLSITMSERLKKLERVTKDWWFKAMNTKTSEFDWSGEDIGVISFVEVDGMVKAVKHCSGVTAKLPPTIALTKGSDISKPWSDWECGFYDQYLAVPFVQRFEEFESFRQDFLSYEAFKEEAERHQNGLACVGLESKVGKVTASPEVLPKVAMKRKGPPTSPPVGVRMNSNAKK